MSLHREIAQRFVGGPGDWVEVSGGIGFSGAWVNYGAGEETAAHQKDAAGRVWLRGVIKTGTSGTTAFTLPTGQRPPGKVRLPVVASGGIAFVIVDTDGTVKPTNIGASAVATLCDLAGASFSTL